MLEMHQGTMCAVRCVTYITSRLFVIMVKAYKMLIHRKHGQINLKQLDVSIITLKSLLDSCGYMWI
jgi:hypothetical protein